MVVVLINPQHTQRVTGMDWAAKSNQLVTCAAVSRLCVCIVCMYADLASKLVKQLAKITSNWISDILSYLLS